MAPSSRAVQKAEAKYGVTADYPDLQLHSAAANGNVGLVKYALMHGQPVNSVLNGVLPIHIAASSGNEHVVQMLIDAGADVNAARLPRKYNTDRAKASSSIGAAGSTPLHFAAANGHLSVVTLLLSHNANPATAEKHGLTPEDLARDAGHVDVVTALQLWKRTADQYRNDSDNVSMARSTRSARDTPSRRYLPSATSIKDLRAAAAANAASSSPGSSVYSGGTGKKLLSSTPFESISNRSKKLAKAASNPNLAALLHGHSSNSHPQPHTSAPSPQFPAPAPLTLRQNPANMQTMLRQTTQPLPSNSHLMHHVINTDKARRPSLPSVLEKAAHPSASLKSALGMTPRSTHFGKNRSASASSQSDRHVNDPYHFGGPRRSGSKTSLSNVFRSNNSRERSGDSSSQPISPAASTFFTADDELEEAERDAFMQMERDPSSGDETYLQHHLPSHRPGSAGYPEGRQQPSHAYRTAEWGNGRSRAGSGSSAATTTSGSIGRGYPSTIGSAQNYPVTAPPTQTSFFSNERSASSANLHDLGMPRPSFSSYISSSSNLVIPQPIPPPPSSSTQPFFSKAAIAAAHNNIPTQRPGFYRPRKSSQLSTSTSTMSGSKLHSLHSPDLQSQTPRQFSPLLSNDSSYDEEGFRSSSDYATREVTHVTGGPSVVIRRPTVREPMNSSANVEAQRNGGSPSPSTGLSQDSTPSPALARSGSRSDSTYAGSAGSRHTRASSDGTGSIRPSGPIGSLPDVVETAPETRQRSQSHGPTVPWEENGSSEVDPETAREIEDTFPVNQERPFPTRSRAGSRARVDSVGSSGSSVPYSTASPSLQPSTAFTSMPYYNGGHETDSSWSGITRPSRSGSTTTDTRTSRSGSTGEGSGHAPRFFGFEYSSSPGEPYQTYNTEIFTSTSRTASTSSFNYQPSDSTNATSLISSPPGTALSGRFGSSAPPSEGKGTTVTHAQAQTIVKRKEEELLSYNPSVASSESDGGKHLSLSQQLAAYGESLSIERELSHAEAHKDRHSAEPVTLTIPEPPASAKYSWEILGKETRTTVPLTAGKRTKEVEAASRQAPQSLWTHKMVSPFEASLPRPSGQASGHRHTASNSTMATITSSGKPLQRVSSREPATNKSASTSPNQSQDNGAPAQANQTLSPIMTRDVSLRNKISNLSVSTSYLAPPRGGSDVSATRRSPRSVSANLQDKSPRSSIEKERSPSTTYHLAAKPGSDPTDSANSSLVSEPRSMRSLNTVASSYATATPYSSRHRNNRSDQTPKSQSPESTFVNEETPRPQPQILRLETTMAPKFHIEPKAGGEFAPTPTKSRFANKIGKLFK